MYNTKTSSVTAIQQIEGAIVFLAGRCDGANTIDGQGFNGLDSETGHWMADFIGREGSLLRAKSLAVMALPRLRKYQKQLELASITLPTSEELEAAYAALPKEKPVKKSNVIPFSVRPEESLATSSDPLRDRLWKHSPLRVDLSGQQQEAFDLAHEWFFNDPDQPFVITGAPGTGKSYLVQRIFQSIRQIWEAMNRKAMAIALCSPTHRSRAILENFAYEAGLTDATITTLHSLLHLMPGKPDEHGRIGLKVNTFSKGAHYREFDLVGLDEVSMVGDDLFEHIPLTIPCIMTGDVNQLPPVDTDPTHKDDDAKESPIFGLAAGYHLTEVIRYDGAIASYAKSVQRTIESLRTGDLSQRYPESVKRFVSIGGNLSIVQNQSAWEDELCQTFRESFEDGTLDLRPNAIKATAWTNKRVNQLNELIRAAVFPNAKEPFVAGDRLMAKEPIFQTVTRTYGKNEYECEEIAMQTCAECTVEGVTKKMDSFSLRGQKIELIYYVLSVRTDTDDQLNLSVIAPHSESWESVRLLLLNFKQQILDADDPTTRKGMWRDWFASLEALNLVVKGNTLLPRLQYAFACTVHQMQGGTYDRVFSDQSNMFGCQQPRTRSQLIYVAATRAAKQLTVYSKF